MSTSNVEPGTNLPQTQTASGIDLMSRKEAMKIILEWNLVTDLIQGTRAIVEAFLN